MADIEDVGPDKDLRALARRIPPEARSMMTPTEIRLRAEVISALYAEAEACDSDADARQLRRDADRYLNAVALVSYVVFANALAAEIDAHRARGETSAALRLGDELIRFSRMNPQVVMSCAASDPEATAAILAEMAEAHDITLLLNFYEPEAS